MPMPQLKVSKAAEKHHIAKLLRVMELGALYYSRSSAISLSADETRQKMSAKT